jgi:hypothetical protein
LTLVTHSQFSVHLRAIGIVLAGVGEDQPDLALEVLPGPENQCFGPLSALHAHTKAPYK